MTEVADRPGGLSSSELGDRVTDHLIDHIGPEDRIIEIDPPDARIALALAEHGRRRYLGLVEAPLVASLRREAPHLADRFQPRPDHLDPRAVSADVLVFRPNAARVVWSVGAMREVRTFLVPLHAIEPRLLMNLRRATGRLRSGPSGRLGGVPFRAFDRPHPHGVVRPRVHLSPAVGYPGLFAKFSERGLEPVVLRWFDLLPDLPPGEDLDLLVSDDQLEAVRATITEEPGILPIDVYSVSGLPGSDREGVACYPPDLAQRILERRVAHPTGAWVPSPEDHLHALAYHILYHKGAESGLPSRLAQAEGAPEHEYSTILRALGSAIGIEIPVEMEALDEYLAKVGWRPPMDTLRKLSLQNPWVRRRFFDSEPCSPDDPQTAVFILRERAQEVTNLEEVGEVLRHLGFEILERRILEPEAAERCRTQLRGGNWGPGPYPTSGGHPHAVLVGLHYGPEAPGEELRRTYPHLTNVHVLTAKETIRDMVNDRLPPDRRCNAIHSSDNEEEAWEYAAVALSEEVHRLKSMVEERRSRFMSSPGAREVLSRGRRARVEVIDWDGRPAVRKTFGWGFRTHLQRELEAERVLAGHRGVLPSLAHGENWIVRPLVEDRLQYDEDSPELVPLEILNEMVALLRSLHEAGYGLIDANPENFVMDEDGLKLIDFEFLYKYEGEPPPFHESYSWHGPPTDLDIDRPVGPISYEKRWLPWTGLPVEALCYASVRRQRLLRVVYRVTRRVRSIGRMIKRSPRFAKGAARWAKGRARVRLGRMYRRVADRRARLS
jgi:hypothetical protein